MSETKHDNADPQAANTSSDPQVTQEAPSTEAKLATQGASVPSDPQVTQEAPSAEHKLSTQAASVPSDPQVTQEAPFAEDEQNSTEPAKEEATKELPSPGGESQHDAPTQPSKKDHNSDYYRTYLMDKDNALHRMLYVPQTRELRAPFDVKKLTLHIRGMKEQIVLTAERVVIVGRADLRSEGFKPDIDLTPYGGRERGVSRAHVRLHLQDGQLFLTDLYSANGTFMGGEKLVAEKPYELHNGDELLFGALGVRVEIVDSTTPGS